MDREALVEEVQKVVRELRKREGPLALLMLVSPDPSVADDWNIIVSARGFNSKTRAEGVRELTDVLRRTLSKNVWPKIKRVTVLRTDDSFVNAMTSAFETRKSVLDLQSCNVAGFDIPKAIVFASKKLPPEPALSGA